jgi:hypothetical protein
MAVIEVDFILGQRGWKIGISRKLLKFPVSNLRAIWPAV